MRPPTGATCPPAGLTDTIDPVDAPAAPSDIDAGSAWDGLPAALLVLDGRGHAIDANDGTCRLAGRTRAALGGEGWLALLDDVGRRDLQAALTGGALAPLVLALRAADGATRWVQAALRRQPAGAAAVGGDVSGDDARWLCVLHDVTAWRSAEAEVRAQAQQMRLVADHVPVLIAAFDARDDTCRFANAAYAATFGHDIDSILGRTVPEVIGEEAAREIAPHVEQVKRHHRTARYERRLQGPDGPRWLEVYLVPQLDDRGELVACYVLISDITRHRLSEAAAREAQSRMEKFLHASTEGIAFHRDGVITDVNPPLLALVGHSLDEMIGRRTLDFVPPDETPRVAAVLAAGPEITYESALLHKRGHRIPVEYTVRSVKFDGVTHRMVIVRDLRDRQAAQARIQYLAHHDELTGLPNRTAFHEQLEHLMGAAQAGGTSLALLFIDLDHFKRVNDSLGHLCGDALLRRAAHRMRMALRSTDVVARFGGDEFLVLLPATGGRASIEDVVRALLSAIAAPFDIEGQSISITPSVGIAMYPDDGDTAEVLLKHADHAMYRAKGRGRATYQFYEQGRASEAYAALVVESQLAQAVARDEFVLHYQPKVRATDGSLVGVEALIRWKHPQRGLLWPEAFIPVAEQRRLMLPIGLWVLREAAGWAGRWLAATGRPVSVAVNLSSVQFRASDFIESVARVLAETHAPAGLVEIELTERMLMDDIGEVRHILGRLHELGLRVSVDDFGTGYSSLGHLKDLPIDRLKIDQSFVQGLPDDAGSGAIVRAMIRMAQDMGMTVVAEGVETLAQQTFLREHGCHHLQGDLIGVPLDEAAFAARWSAEPTPGLSGSSAPSEAASSP